MARSGCSISWSASPAGSSCVSPKSRRGSPFLTTLLQKDHGAGPPSRRPFFRPGVGPKIKVSGRPTPNWGLRSRFFGEKVDCNLRRRSLGATGELFFGPPLRDGKKTRRVAGPQAKRGRRRAPVGSGVPPRFVASPPRFVASSPPAVASPPVGSGIPPSFCGIPPGREWHPPLVL